MSDNRVGLRLGDLVLADGNPRTTSDRYWFEVSGDEFTTGDPQPVEVQVFSLLRDSDLTKRVKDGNREASLLVKVCSTDSVGLAEGVAALEAQTNKGNVLGFTPPDAYASETLFDVLTSSMSQASMDGLPMDFALTKNQMAFRLRLVCKAFARPATTVIAPAISAPAVTPTTTTISTADSTTGWTIPYGTLTDAGSYLFVSSTKSPRPTWTGSVGISGQPYVSLIVRSTDSSGLFTQPVTNPMLYVNDQAAEFIGTSGVSGNPTYTRYTFKTAETTATKVLFACDNFPTFSQRLLFYSLTASNVPPFSGTLRQTKRSIDVAGTARTEGSLQIWTESGQLGTVLAYTWNGLETYMPALRQYRLSGPTPTISSATVSGSYELLSTSTPTVFEVPVSTLMDGAHELIVRLQGSTAFPESNTITYSCQTRIAGTDIGDARTGSAALSGIPGLPIWGCFSLGVTDLVSPDLPDNTSAVVRIALTPSTAQTRLDEAWIFNVQFGDLTWLEAGAKTRVWIDDATTERPYPAAMIGTSADRSDAYSARGVNPVLGSHEFVPPVTQAFIVTTDVLSAQAQLEHYPRSRFLTTEV